MKKWLKKNWAIVGSVFLVAIFIASLAQTQVWSKYFPGNVFIKGILKVGERIDVSEEFKTNPVTAKIAGGAAGGTAGDENVMDLGYNIFEYHILGTQTILAPSLATRGLDIAMDLTANDGVEIGQGILSRSNHCYVAQTDACYIKVKFWLTDVSGTDDCAVGFRKSGAYQAAIDDYTDMAALNVISGDIKIETILNNAATVTTDTTDNWADSAAHTLEVFVNQSGKAYFSIDGSAPTVTASFTFDADDKIIPFFYFLHDVDIAEGTLLQSWKCGKP